MVLSTPVARSPIRLAASKNLLGIGPEEPRG
jgi:hypothetical protein